VRDVKPFTVLNQALARIRIREDVKLLPDFLQAILSSPIGQIQITAIKRPVAQGNLSLSEAGQIFIPVISVETQERIVDEIARRRAEARRLRTEAEAIVTKAKARVERMILGEEAVA
jgi:type I restriction enzyme S subunit